MNPLRGQTTASLIVLALMIAPAWHGARVEDPPDAANAAQRALELASSARTVRSGFPKTLPAVPDGERFSDQQVVVKFREGMDVETTPHAWVASAAHAAAEGDSNRLQAADLDGIDVARSVADANAALDDDAGARLMPLLSARVDAALHRSTAAAERSSGSAVADLGLYSFVVLPSPDPAGAQRLIDSLADNPSVEQVYAQPIPRDADIDPPTTIDLRSSQGYLSPAPTGIDLPFAHRFSLSRGEGVSVVDVEAGWQLDHEDLPGPDAVFSWHGINTGGDHGTAVAGELWGQENAIGIDGIAPHSHLGWSSVVGAQLFPNPVYSPAAAIVNAAADLSPGDVILVEQHMPEPFTGIAAPPDQCNPSQLGYLPVEIFGAEYDAISAATAKGIVVVEAAGNGSMNLDGYAQFDRTVRDSGAIIVSASRGGGDRTPACWANSGSRVDVFSWGGAVATLGYGPDPSLQANGSDPRQWYTRSFSGTSSASPIVAGTAAVIQGIRARQGLRRLTSTEMRTLLSSTGTPQLPGKPIGTQPDLRAALRATLPDTGTLTIRGLPQQLQPGQPVTGTVRLSNTGATPWTSADHPVRCSWQGHPLAVNTGQIAGEMNIGDVAQVAFSTSAPTTAGSAELRCQLTADAVVAGDSASAIIATGNVFDAEITAFELPATMPYGLDGDLAEPRDGTITVRNTGSTTWDLAQYPTLGVLTRPTPGVPEMAPLSATVPPGQTVTVTAPFDCIRAGRMTATVQMTLGSAGFGTIGSAATRCVG
jgi:serine protease